MLRHELAHAVRWEESGSAFYEADERLRAAAGSCAYAQLPTEREANAAAAAYARHALTPVELAELASAPELAGLLAAAPPADVVRETLLFSNVRIEERTTIERAVILPQVSIGSGCTIKNAILDEGCVVPDAMQAGATPGRQRGGRASPRRRCRGRRSSRASPASRARSASPSGATSRSSSATRWSSAGTARPGPSCRRRNRKTGAATSPGFTASRRHSAPRSAITSRAAAATA